MSLALRTNAGLGVEERLEHLPTPRGDLYSWTAIPPNPKVCVVVCSSILGDFLSNYQRERLVGRALARRGVGVVRFHYAGEGNSQGDRRYMTFASLCDDARVAINHASSLGFEKFALLGTRIGALVAAYASPSEPLALWEPVTDPLRFIRDAQRAKLLSQLVQHNERRVADWRLELEEKGVLDLFGYDVYQPLIESFEAIDLIEPIGTNERRVFIARFGSRTTAPDRVVVDLEKLGFRVESGSYGAAESWWLNSETVAESRDLVTATTTWLSNVLMDST